MDVDKQWSVVRVAAGIGALLAGLGVALVVGIVIGNVTAGATKTVTVGGAATSGAADTGTTAAVSEPAVEPDKGWGTNGGSLTNRRYSPLDEIDTGNVKDLKGDWEAHLGGSGAAAKYSGEATPVVKDGVIYTITGADDVFATDADTGRQLWKYEAKLDQKIDTVCCGWTNRGVALGDGKVYFGRLDGLLIALDQRTGKKVWEAKVGDWRKGETVTAAPLFYDGRVYSGLSGGEYGLRGRLTAFDAKTGRLDWRFYTTPGPGEVGHDTWPSDNDAWKHGGAPVWQTPSVDPKLGLMYFSTGNAAPDFSGAARAGDNLFSSSIVAIDAKTGKYKWHFQQVHHDIWDFDSPSPTFLFDVKIDGKTVGALGEASKTGWLYLLDRRTGKPLLPVKEQAVAQNAGQKTAKTQPIPSWPQYVQSTPSDKQIADIAAVAKKANKGKPVKIRKGKMFDAYGKGYVAFSPAAQGGTNWPPSSYNEKTGLAYVCGVNGAAAYSTSGPAKHVPGQGFYGSALQLTGFQPHPGVIAAIDVATGQIKWRKNLPTACYSGTTTTAGNLVFVGHNDGTLRAYDAENGDQLWSFQVGAGANSTPAIFEQGGKEKIAFYAAGSSLMGNAHGDSLWLMSLDGKLGPVKAGASQAAIAHAGEAAAPAAGTKAKAGDSRAGTSVFADNCASCHGPQAKGGNGGPDISAISDTQRIIKQVTDGGGGMPPFKGILTTQDIKDVAAFLSGNAGK
jgi:alcohol dehydrogenase (cytochrome c)